MLTILACGRDVFTFSSSVVKPLTGGDPAERHPPGSGHPRADEDPGGCGRSGLGQGETPEQVLSGLLSHGKASERVCVCVCPGVGHHPPDVRVHQPHGSARGAGTLAGVPVREAAAAASSDHLRHQPETPGRKAAPVLASRLSARRRVL